MTKLAGALLVGLSLVALVVMHLGYQWLLHLRGAGLVPMMRELIPLHVLMLVYSGIGVGAIMLFRTPRQGS